MTTNEIYDVIITSLTQRQFPIFLTTFAGCGFQEADVLGINKNGYIYEFEVKRSRADFFAEFRNKEHKHRLLKDRKAIHVYDEWKNGKKTGNSYERILIPNRYYFVCEDGLIAPNEVPEYAGLLYIEKGCLLEKKPAKLLHKNKANTEIYERVATVLSQRIIYGCSYYSYKHKQRTEREERYKELINDEI
jgi:hypothetical protein